MQSHHGEPPETSVSRCSSTDPQAAGVLLCRDLIFTTKITQTAAALGYRILVAEDTSRARSLIETSRPRVVFIDLTAGEMVAPGPLSEYVKLAGPHASLVAFGPHVEGASLAAAKTTGCHAVLTRSKFTADLPGLMRHYFQ
jgi:hypothetical protein